ncbi:MAG TPA: nucleotidyltransferase domain-containing protein [Membranihabitans sp.]|nr:nucleotidyltransferase domain-containing protein [Membranihabitans sp.]
MSILRSIKNEVNQISLDNKVVLFGSRARGDETKDSDWDILILLPAMTEEIKDKIRDKLYELELTTDQVISPIIHSFNGWENRSVTAIYQIINEEGIEYEVLQSTVDQV